MFGDSIFTLLTHLKSATTFEELCDLLVAGLPPITGGCCGSVYQLFDHSRVEMIRGAHFPEEDSAEMLLSLNAMLPQHPLGHKILTPLGDHPGFAVSSFMPSEVYRQSDLLKRLSPECAISDTLVGELFTWCRRSALLLIHRQDGEFQAEELERFRLVVFTANTICERIAGRNVEREVHHFFMNQSESGPVTAFMMKKDGGVMPVNHEALRFVEAHWPADEAFRQLDDNELKRVMSRVESSWQDPLRARFQAVDLDLGAGVASFYVLPNALRQFYLFTIGASHVEPVPQDRSRSVLTGRQCEIMDWIAEGKTSWEVATILGISPRTVEKHMEAIFQRLNVENRVAAARRYLDLKAGKPL